MKRPGIDRRRRSPDAWASEHERARIRAAQRLDGPLGSRESAWLDEHLANCPACAAVAAEYEAQRQALHDLLPPAPPRDLWARTAAALDRETPARRRRWPIRSVAAPIGALAGVLVVAVVVGASVLAPSSSPQVAEFSAAASAPSIHSFAPASTPLSVSADQVAFLRRTPDGRLEVSHATVRKVCSDQASADCPTLDAGAGDTLALRDTPANVIGSPDKTQLIVVDQGTQTSGGGTVYLVVLPTPTPNSSTSPTVPQPSPSATATATSSAASASPTTPIASATPSTRPSVTPPASPSTAASPSTTPGSSPSPSPPASPPASGSPTPSGSGSPLPSPSPGSVVPIADGLIVLGQSAAYSSDGTWFAFTARPADRSHGPDIYVWSPGDASAHPVTDDHRSVFSAWIGNDILASRLDVGGVQEDGASPAPSASDGDAAATASVTPSERSPSNSSRVPRRSDGSPGTSGAPGQATPLLGDATPFDPSGAVSVPAHSFLLDPASGIRRDIVGPAIYRPVVDPSGQFVVYWRGSISVDAAGNWQASEGQLVLAHWDPSQIAPSPEPSAVPTDAASAEPASASATPASSAASQSAVADPSLPPALASPAADVVEELATGPLTDWDVRWDESGSHVAVWIADATDRTIGRLSLYSIDPATGAIDVDAPALTDQLALAGFSIQSGRLAWVTVPGQGGGPSRVQILAWSGDAAGRIETQPGTDLTVIR